MELRTYEIIMIAESAFRHGTAYAQGKIHRYANKFYFKCPQNVGLPHWVEHLEFDDLVLVNKVYIHAFRAGLKQGGTL
jgi:hypothetical protein